MFDRIVVPEVTKLSHEVHELRRLIMAFADSLKKLQADVATLIAENGPAAVAAAVAANDASNAAAVDAVDATVVAALAPAAPAAPAA
jgi:peptidoglycan hydrolase CwlO-like protein